MKKSKQASTNRTEINYLKAAIKTAIDQHLTSHPEITRDEITKALLGIASEYTRVWSPPGDVMTAEELEFMLAIEMDYQGLPGKAEDDLLDTARQSAAFMIAMPKE